jgi:hypothetical protein
MMVGTTVVKGVVVNDSGLSHHAFLGDLGLGHDHAHGHVAVLDALPSSTKVVREWKKDEDME